MNDEIKNEQAEKVQFKVGNQFWRIRSSHGRKPLFETAQQLEQACFEYFDWVYENPLQSVELVKYAGEATQAVLPKMRPMTIMGLCIFLDITFQTWSNYREKADFIEVTERVEAIIYQYKFEGAAADLLNANIISRELGLADKHENTGSGRLEIAGDVLYRKGAITHIESEYVDP